MRRDPKSRSSRKVAIASAIGTAIEWYDFYLFGTASALIFNKLFFPEIDPVLGIMSSFATLALGFFARPIGGLIFGHFGDKLSRKDMLILTLVIMGSSTFLIGLIPSYKQIGIWAPILLVILRCFQGIGVGGEWGGAIVMTAEHSRPKERGFYSSWPNAGAPLGLVLAIGMYLIFSAMPEEYFLSWGWRIPFLSGVALLLVGLFIRLKVLESPIFKNKKRKSKRPALDLIRTSPKNFLLALGARFAESSSYYIFSVFIISYTTEWLKLPKNAILLTILIASIVEGITIPFFGSLTDKTGRRPIYIGGAILVALFAFPYFWLVQTKNVYLIFIATFVGLSLAHGAMHGAQAAFYPELFKTRFRYSGTAIAYHLSAAISGGLAPLIATAILSWTKGSTTLISIYLISMCIITIVSVYIAIERAQDNISD